MKSKIITAVFKGQNGSCGYYTNKKYALKIGKLANGDIQIQLAGENEQGVVEYTSIISFLNNWNKIEVMN